MRTPTDTVFPLAPASARFRLWLWLLTGVLPVVVAGGLFAYLAIEGNLSWTTALIGFVATVLPLFLIGVTISRQAGRHRLVLGSDWIGVATGAHRRRLALAGLDLERARVLDLDEHLDFRPRLKTNGAFLPGFQTGWYRLRNGERALVARADGSRVLWIPTTQDFSLLLQPAGPARELLAALRQAATRRGTDGATTQPPPPPGKTYWFPAKQIGWGWGIPTAWQGWVVLGLFIAGVIALTMLVPDNRQFVGMALLVAALLAVCFLKGEPPRWRWGIDDGDDDF